MDEHWRKTSREDAVPWAEAEDGLELMEQAWRVLSDPMADPWLRVRAFRDMAMAESLLHGKAKGAYERLAEVFEAEQDRILSAMDPGWD